MSRKSRQHAHKNLHSRRFIDDVTGEVGYTNKLMFDHNNRMVKPENWDPVPPQQIIPEIEYPETPENSRPRAPTLYRSFKNPYDFESSYLDRLNYINTGISLAELNPENVVLQLENMPAWEEIDVVWNAEYSMFTNDSWNANINFIDDILDDVFVFGARITKRDIRLPGED